jgi:hypothetical protein
LNIYIPHTHFPVTNKKVLFILTRPFFKETSWGDSNGDRSTISLDFCRVEDISKAEIVLIPFPVNWYYGNNKMFLLREVDSLCQKHNIKGYAYVSGDFGIAFPEFGNITYFRMGGFLSQLSKYNKGFPVALSDHFQRIYQMETIKPIAKRELPIVGFCGHATLSTLKRVKELGKCLKENGRRFLRNPFRKDWEPLFASAYERAQLLKYFENSPLVMTDFIYRNQYRAGAQTDLDRQKTTLEYYNNIVASDYVLCVRGAGNFSVRFYETLMMGKTPVFVNTDCLLPFEDQIDWKQHVIWVEWKDRENVAAIVSDFHRNISNEDFMQLQLDNRKLWKERLSVAGMLEMIASQLR